MARRRKVTPGDGHELPRYRWWQPFSRALFHLALPGEDGRPHTWSIDVRLGGDGDDGEVRARLYLDGRHTAVSKLPASFPVPGGRIEVAASAYGLKRCHFVGDDGTVRQLSPDPVSAEGRRARLQRDHPLLSRVIGGIAILVLLVGVVVGVPQILEQITSIPPIAERVGVFVSPIRLPVEWNIAVLVATVVASTERALRLRYHWLLDGGLVEGEE